MIDKDNPTIEKNNPDKDELEIILPSDMEVEAAMQEFAEGGGVDVNLTADGGAEIAFGEEVPGADNVGQDHNANMADAIDEVELRAIASDLMTNYDDYINSRKDWADTYTNGLDLLGFKYENRTEPFAGASGATHPVLAEAVTQFQAGAYRELLPASGPVRTHVVGKKDAARELQADRVKEFMNYQIMNVMKEYEPEFDQMLFNLPLSGSTFKKIYYDSQLGRCVSKFVPAEDLVVPYNATSLEDAEAICHVIRMSSNELRKSQVSGFYSDVDLQPGTGDPDDVIDKKDELQGVRNDQTEIYTLIEHHVELDIPGYEDLDAQNEPTGIKLPYIVTIEDNSNTILAIRRNWEEKDPTRKRKDYFVHFKFLPGLGFYGFGLIHMIGGLSRTATAALRQLLDAGTLANLPAGFKMRGIRVRDEAQPLQPGEFRDVDAPGGNLRDAFMPLPFQGPNQTLLSLMGVVVQGAQRFASIADMQVGDGNQGAAVGTTVALLERGSRVMSAIHKRMYQAMKCEFMLLGECFVSYLPPQYPYDVVGGERQVFATDFDANVDIIPVADPNIFSQAQRIQIAQTEMQLVMSKPEMHNTYQAFRDMYEALGIKDIDSLLTPPAQPAPSDPSTENILVLNQKPIQAYPKQDHQAHMRAHLQFMGTMTIRNNPAAMGALQQNCMEHITLMSQEQIEMEFEQELKQLEEVGMQLQQLQQQQGPQVMENEKVKALVKQMEDAQMFIESRKAQLIALFMEEYAIAEKEVLNVIENDPLLQLKDRELDLKARDNQRREKEGQQQMDIDQARLYQARDIAEDKLEQADEHAKLRASVSLTKDGIKSMKSNIVTN
tara:strand:- start:1613 stop:4114 length:2502 start_codon:yes stop_codon:yes gene_type:complete